MSGRLHFLNYPSPPTIGQLVHAEPLLLEHHQDCFATPRQRLPDRRYTGCLYNRDGLIIRLSQRPSSGALNKPVDERMLEAIPHTLDRQIGRTIYLGSLFQHFGHFILESLSRLWAINTLGSSFDGYYFHGWNGPADAVILGKDVAAHCLAALGIPVERVRVVPEGGTTFEQCWVPQQLFEVNHHASEQFDIMLDAIVDHVVQCASSASDGADRIYLSRIHQARRAENEEEIEAIFRRFGFLIVAPEQLSFSEQVALVSRAKVLAGCAGSNMHLAAFAKSATILSLDPRIVVNQLILETLRRHTAHHLWALREQVSRTRWIADLATIRVALNSVFNM